MAVIVIYDDIRCRQRAVAMIVVNGISVIIDAELCHLRSRPAAENRGVGRCPCVDVERGIPTVIHIGIDILAAVSIAQESRHRSRGRRARRDLRPVLVPLPVGARCVAEDHGATQLKARGLIRRIAAGIIIV